MVSSRSQIIICTPHRIRCAAIRLFVFTWIGNLTLQGKDPDHQRNHGVFRRLSFAAADCGCGCLGTSEWRRIWAPRELLVLPRMLLSLKMLGREIIAVRIAVRVTMSVLSDDCSYSQL